MIIAFVLIGSSYSIAGDNWKSQYFEDVQLHRGGPKVTLQIASLVPANVSTESRLPTRLMIYSGMRGSRKLITTYKMPDSAGLPFSRAQFAQDSKSREGLLACEVLEAERISLAVFRFDGTAPTEVTRSFWLSVKDLSKGTMSDLSTAKVAGVKLGQNEHPGTHVRRTLTYNAKLHKFEPGAWHKELFNSPATFDRSGQSHGHSYRVHMKNQNFVLGSRKVAFRNGAMHVGGLRAWGSDFGPSEIAGRDPRQFFMSELTSFQVWIDGKKIVVPSRYWKTCFDIHFPPKIKLSNDGALTIDAFGSDGAGSYAATWKINANGRVERQAHGAD